VFSGVERNSLSWLEIEQIANGFTITKTTKPKFFKNLSNLNIQIKYNPVISILHQTRKQISGNRYIPIKINFKLLVTLDYFLRILKNKIINFLNK
jgi:hemerythrin superfamily protein